MYELAGAYMRRERWRARLLAVEVGRVFAGSASGSGGGTVVGSSGKRYQRVSPAGMIAMLGGFSG